MVSIKTDYLEFLLLNLCIKTVFQLLLKIILTFDKFQQQVLNHAKHFYEKITFFSTSVSGGIKALRYSVPNIDASVIEKLRVEGAIVIAKANLAELGSGKYESELGGSCRVRI